VAFSLITPPKCVGAGGGLPSSVIVALGEANVPAISAAMTTAAVKVKSTAPIKAAFVQRNFTCIFVTILFKSIVDTADKTA
jgi:hypothetical protein